jgi:hypothetical protein
MIVLQRPPHPVFGRGCGSSVPDIADNRTFDLFAGESDATIIR